MKPTITKGGAIGLLYFFLISSTALGQSFFTAKTLPKSENYGTITTRLVPEDLVRLIEKENFTFEQWSSFFFVQTTPGAPPVLGEYGIVNNHLSFSPKFLPDPKVQYFVTFSYPKLGELISQNIEDQNEYTDVASFEPPETTQPEVTSFIPTLNEVPANLLRFYVYFSAPMSLQNPYDFITIEDKSGKALVDPFVVIPEGLWNINHTRLTLLLHPGRIKQGVGPNMTMGDVLMAGNNYTLKISKDWKGASGEPLKATFTQTINATNPLERAMNINSWALRAERKNIGILHVVSDHPLDQPLAKRMLFIRGKDGQILPSRVEFDNPEKFRILWKLDDSDELELVIDPRLEDVCGNTPHYAFDLAGTERTPSKEELKLKFRLE
ncbi:MAG: hypothetical protein RLN88_01635 [Ekhidna sp.]|uniref:hypothetical protein n=1 Tax=Ekhidna sp. TaxID=2608089 RepID=UPI0032EDF13C